MSKTLLLETYKRNGITFKTAEYVYKRSLREVSQLTADRLRFAKVIGTLKKNKADLVYMDETSVNLWQTAHRQKTWMSKA